MVRGLNRQIIEITDTENAYYERAVLFVRPEYEKIQHEILYGVAKKMVRRLNAPSAFKKKKQILYWVTRLVPAAAFGAFAALAIAYFL